MATIYQKLKNRYSINTLSVTENCPLRCSFCNIWQKEEESDFEEKQDLNFWQRNQEITKFKRLFSKLESFWKKKPTSSDLVDLITKEELFEHFKLTEKINLIGGEPGHHEFLKIILSYLKEKNTEIHFWTNGIWNFKEFEPNIDYLDKIYFYLPSILADEYLEITGFDYLDLALENLDNLLDAGKKVIINYPIQLETIQNSPLLTDFTEEKKLPLIIGYNKNQGFTKESIEYIERYRRVKGIKVYKTKKTLKHNCACYIKLAPRGFEPRFKD